MTLPGKVMNFSSWGSGALNHGSFLFYNSTIRRGLDIWQITVIQYWYFSIHTYLTELLYVWYVWYGK